MQKCVSFINIIKTLNPKPGRIYCDEITKEVKGFDRVTLYHGINTFFVSTLISSYDPKKANRYIDIMDKMTKNRFCILFNITK